MSHGCDSSAATRRKSQSLIHDEAGVLTRHFNGASIMMRKIAIGLAAAVIATGGLTFSASAHRGGTGGHHGGGFAKGGAGKFGMYRGDGMYRTGRVGPRSFGTYRPDRFGPRQYGYYRGRHFDHWRHHWRPGYSYYGGHGGACWRNVWTPGGWTRQWVCGGGYGEPYGYSGGYYRHWHGPRHGRWGGGLRGYYGRR
jgi:hypothetical protein